jgi:hypothetical protein
MGNLGRFKKLKKRLKKITKPIGMIAKPLLSMTQGGGGLLTAMGPWGWAAGAAMAAGGALAAKHRKKKAKKRQRRAEQAETEAVVAPPDQVVYRVPTADESTMPTPATYAPDQVAPIDHGVPPPIPGADQVVIVPDAPAFEPAFVQPTEALTPHLPPVDSRNSCRLSSRYSCRVLPPAA